MSEENIQIPNPNDVPPSQSAQADAADPNPGVDQAAAPANAPTVEVVVGEETKGDITEPAESNASSDTSEDRSTVEVRMGEEAPNDDGKADANTDADAKVKEQKKEKAPETAQVPEASTAAGASEIPTSTDKAKRAEEPKSDARPHPRNKNRKVSQAAPAERQPAVRRRTSNRESVRGMRRPLQLKQVDVTLEGMESQVIKLDAQTVTRVVRLNDASRSKCVMNLHIKLYTQPAQRLLERNFQHVSWSADKIAEYIRRNLRNEKIVEFENIVDEECSSIADQLNQGIEYFTQCLEDAACPNEMKFTVSYTAPVEYELAVESNAASRFVRLVLQFDQLCKLIDVLTISDQMGDGANVKHAREVIRWRNIINKLTTTIIGGQRSARQLILTNQIPNATSKKAMESLKEAAQTAEVEEAAFDDGDALRTPTQEPVEDVVEIVEEKAPQAVPSAETQGEVAPAS